MRGKPVLVYADEGAPGITPAHAGKTAPGLIRCESFRDHPRACGENRPSPRPQWSPAGSPPRMRGKPIVYPTDTPFSGITPAHAGKTAREPGRKDEKGDHPRACGENHMIGGRSMPKAGSPPRMRGKPRLSRDARADDGITPAHAGKTPQAGTRFCTFRDHPRACGENRSASSASAERAGSPPRMRGKHFHGSHLSKLCGITPAHAGKTQHRSHD